MKRLKESELDSKQLLLASRILKMFRKDHEFQVSILSVFEIVSLERGGTF